MYTWAGDILRWHWSVDALFDSCQLTMTWMSIRMPTVKLNTDCICLGTCVASYAWSLPENNTLSLQKTANKRAYYMYFSHMIKNFNNSDCLIYKSTTIFHDLTTFMKNLKCSKLKWNHELHWSVFTVKFWTFWYHFYGHYESGCKENIDYMYIPSFFLLCSSFRFPVLAWSTPFKVYLDISICNHHLQIWALHFVGTDFLPGACY